MRRVIFIRHGATAGNAEKRYIGRTDETVTAQSLAALKARAYPPADTVYTSPMKRCVQTAEVIYGGADGVIYDMRECDFGDFEGKNYLELGGNASYQAWIDSNGTLPFPNGEAHDEFKARCAAAFLSALDDGGEGGETVAFVVHGGTIMAVLERFGDPPGDFYAWHVGNGEGFETEFDGVKLRAVKKI